MRALLICNPNAGRQGVDSRVRPAVDVLTARGWDIEVRPTTGPGDATALAAKAVARGMEAVIAAGGDGTLNEVAQALACTDVALGYFPCGTVNVWARELGIPLDPVGAATAFADGAIRTVDLGRANDRYFLLMAGIGLDGAVVRRARGVERFKSRFGVLPYVAAGLATVPVYRGEDIELRYDGIIRRVQTLMLVVGNTRLYGGFWRFTPNAVANDGWLDLCIVKGRGPVSLLRHALPLLLRGAVGRGDVELLRVRELDVTAPRSVPFQLDGELAGELPVHFSVVPAALRVMVPRDVPLGLIA